VPVVAADEPWGWVEAGELLQHRHDVFGLAAPAHPDGEAETAVLVDQIEELEPPAIGGGVELEVPLLRRSPRATPRTGAGAQPGDVAPSRQPGVTSSACEGWAAAGPPRARAGAPACSSPSSLPAATGGGPCAGPTGCAQLRSRGDDASAWPPQDRRPCRHGAGCCGADPPCGRPSAGMPGNAPAGL